MRKNHKCPICTGPTDSWSHHFCVMYVGKRLMRYLARVGHPRPAIFNEMRGRHDVNYNELLPKPKYKELTEMPGFKS